MPTPERTEPPAAGNSAAESSFSDFFHEAYDKGIVKAFEEHPKEAVITAIGAAAIGAAAICMTKGGALFGMLEGATEDGASRAASPALLEATRAAETIEVGGGLDPAMARLAAEGTSVKTVTLAPVAHDAAALENALDHSALAPRELPIIELPKDFDPQKALADRAAVIEDFATGRVKPASIKISWGTRP
jgi:hypothetical protein